MFYWNIPLRWSGNTLFSSTATNIQVLRTCPREVKKKFRNDTRKMGAALRKTGGVFRSYLITLFTGGNIRKNKADFPILDKVIQMKILTINGTRMTQILTDFHGFIICVNPLDPCNPCAMFCFA